MTFNHSIQSARSLAAAAEEAGFSLSTYAVLAITEALVSAGVNFAEAPAPYGWHTYEGRVLAAMREECVQEFVRAGKRINAIKALRALSVDQTGTAISLRDAKEAVEDYRVFPLTPGF